MTTVDANFSSYNYDLFVDSCMELILKGEPIVFDNLAKTENTIFGESSSEEDKVKIRASYFLERIFELLQKIPKNNFTRLNLTLDVPILKRVLKMFRGSSGKFIQIHKKYFTEVALRSWEEELLSPELLVETLLLLIIVDQRPSSLLRMSRGSDRNLHLLFCVAQAKNMI